MKTGSKPQHSIKKVGLLHFASACILQSDHLDKMLEIPSRIAISQLRPGIVLYYISTKAVILLELTCPCEKNIEVWLNKKFEKSLAMVSNGWSLHLFLTEVGGRGYFSVTRKSCSMRLRFSTSLVKSTLKSFKFNIL